MKQKVVAILWLLICFVISAWAYDVDVIITNGGQQIQCYIVEQTSTSVSYVLAGGEDSQVHVLPSDQIRKIYPRNPQSEEPATVQTIQTTPVTLSSIKEFTISAPKITTLDNDFIHRYQAAKSVILVYPKDDGNRSNNVTNFSYDIPKNSLDEIFNHLTGQGLKCYKYLLPFDSWNEKSGYVSYPAIKNIGEYLSYIEEKEHTDFSTLVIVPEIFPGLFRWTEVTFKVYDMYQHLVWERKVTYFQKSPSKLSPNQKDLDAAFPPYHYNPNYAFLPQGNCANWTEDDFKQYAQQDGMAAYEGIYQKEGQHYYIKQYNDEYAIVACGDKSKYLDGDVKGSLEGTAVPNLFVGSWKKYSSCTYTFDETGLAIQSKELDAPLKFVKIWPKTTDYSKKDRTFVQTAQRPAASAPQETTSATKQVSKQQPAQQSHVDTNIPVTNAENENTFVIIIANESYKNVASVPYALNDGRVFAKYCQKTLGIPATNIKVHENATYNDLRLAIAWLKNVCEKYEGEASVIFYYAGHGIPDASDKSAYLLPVDGDGRYVATGYKLDELYQKLGDMPSKSITVLLDACFSGANRDGKMLASERGIALKSRPGAPKGKMVVIAAAQGDETALPNDAEGHGLFTYYLLKKLQETQGDITLRDLSNFIIREVGKKSAVISKPQTPTVTPSAAVVDSWQTWKLK